MIAQGPDTVPCWACGGATRADERYPGVGLLACDACGLRFASDRTEAAVRDLYGEGYFEGYAGGAYDEDVRQRRWEARMRLRYLRRHAEPGRLLEFGVAGGWFLEAVARDGRFEARGVEPSPEIAAAAAERSGVAVAAAFIEDVPLEPGSLDAICAWHVIEHIPSPAGALSALRAGLAPGGVLAIEVPNASSAQARRMGADWPHLDLGHHVAHYGPPALRALLERAGFERVEAETIAGSDYHRPGIALRPAMVAGAVRAALTGRGVPHRSHPSERELLRAVAFAPAQDAASR